MLASQFRLKKSRDITRTLSRGIFKPAGEITVKVIKNGQNHSRTAIIVSKKVSKKAVVRNKIRRRVSGMLQGMWGTVSGGYDIVIIVRQDISGMAAPALKARVVSALGRAAVIKGK